jgi:Soluble lytic murein transglycosylase and related regulatory proteins (some contain LysM/invasin domains)
MHRRFRTSVIIKRVVVFAAFFVFSGVAIGQQFSADGMIRGAPGPNPPYAEPIARQNFGQTAAVVEGIFKSAAAAPYHSSIPISRELQEYTYLRCRELDLDYALVLALIWKESRFTEHAVNINTNGTQDSGLMQINDTNRTWLYAELGIDNLMDPYQNIRAGTEMLSRFTQKHGAHNALLAYQFGEEGMQAQLARGATTTPQIEQLYAKRDEFYTLLAPAVPRAQKTDFWG